MKNLFVLSLIAIAQVQLITSVPVSIFRHDLKEINVRITGNPTEIKDAPYHALVTVRSKDATTNVTTENYFQGSLLENGWVLTCGEALGNATEDNIQVGLGGEDLDKMVTFQVKNIVADTTVPKDEKGIVLLQLVTDDKNNKIPASAKPITLPALKADGDINGTEPTVFTVTSFVYDGLTENTLDFHLKKCKHTATNSACEPFTEYDRGSPMIEVVPPKIRADDSETTYRQWQVLSLDEATPGTLKNLEISKEIVKFINENAKADDTPTPAPTPTPTPTPTPKPDSASSIQAMAGIVCLSFVLQVIFI